MTTELVVQEEHISRLSEQFKGLAVQVGQDHLGRLSVTRTQPSEQGLWPVVEAFQEAHMRVGLLVTLTDRPDMKPVPFCNTPVLESEKRVYVELEPAGTQNGIYKVRSLSSRP